MGYIAISGLQYPNAKALDMVSAQYGQISSNSAPESAWRIKSVWSSVAILRERARCEEHVHVIRSSGLCANSKGQLIEIRLARALFIQTPTWL